MIVAQRVSTIATADNILVLEDGVVIGRGTHDELIATARRTPRSCSRRSARRARHDAHRRSVRTRRGGRSLGARDTAPPGRWNSAGVPGERSKDFKNALRRLGRHARPDVDRARHRRVVSRSSSATLNVLGPAGARARHQHHRAGRDDRARHRLRRAAPRAAARRSRVYVGVGGAVDHRRRTCSPASSSG